MDYRRIIPCLDVKDGRLVKGVNFVQLKDVGDPAENAAAYSQACLLYTSPSPRDRTRSRMPSSA